MADGGYRLDDAVGFLLRRANQRHLSVFGTVIPEVTTTQLAALARLFELGPMSQNQLGRATAMDAATIKGVVGRLVTRRLVTTAPSEEDRRRLIVDGFRAIGLPTFEPRGAFYTFPDVSVTGMDSVTFSERLLAEERVAVVPGSAFGAHGEGYVRACYASGYEQIERALERIGRFVQRNRRD